MDHALKDTIVLELASVLAGPSVGQFFAELGADVIKIENHRAGGDVTRSWRKKDETAYVSAYFSSVNWGKKSVGIDLSLKEGQDLVHQLVKKSSVVITSFRPGSAEKLGMDYSTLSRLNSDIIYGSISGYGKMSDRVGYDAVIQAESGFMHLNREGHGNPQKMPVALIDILAAHHLKEAILVAWIERITSGRGREIDISLFDTAIASLANQSANYLVGGHDPQPSGSLHPNIAPYGEVLNTKDGRQLVLAIGNDEQFRRLCNILNIPETGQRPEFATNAERIASRAQLEKELNIAARNMNSAEILHLAHESHIPIGEINSVGEALKNADSELRLQHDLVSGIKTFTGTRSLKLSPPPGLGEHTFNVLRALTGLDKHRYEELQKANVLA
ncbi:MAG: CoA transferase [Cyclobacteriaceae bacterium]